MSNLSVLHEQVVLGKEFVVYGAVENPLFLAKDVAEWIEHSKVSMMLKSVDDDEKVKVNNVYVEGRTGGDGVWFLTEDGLYEVLMQSRKPIAKAFKKQVKQILKQIRTTGGYIPVKEEESDAEIMAKALLIANKTIESKNKVIQEKEELIQEQKDFIDNTIGCSTECITVEIFAKLTYGQYGLGRNKMFSILREMKILKYNELKDNVPYQGFVDAGYFELREKRLPKDLKIHTQTMITPKGQKYLHKKLSEYHFLQVKFDNFKKINSTMYTRNC